MLKSVVGKKVCFRGKKKNRDESKEGNSQKESRIGKTFFVLSILICYFFSE